MSSDFPTTPGAFDTSCNSNWDAFVTKLNSSGSALVYSTFLGGTSTEFGCAIAVDGCGCAYVAGYTYFFSDFPTTPGAFDRSYNSNWDAFVTKLNSSGSALVYSTFLGGTSYDYAWAIAVDGSGCAYVAGYTDSSDFPTTPGAFDTSFNGGSGYYDAFVTKLNSTGSALVYSTFLGGTGYDWANAIAVDGSGCAYVAGYTRSPDFPTTPGAFDTSFNSGDCDAFITKLDSSGSALVYSTFLGGTSTEYGCAIAVDGSGCAYVAGVTSSSDFPTTPGAFDRSFNGATAAFVTKLRPPVSVSFAKRLSDNSFMTCIWGIVTLAQTDYFYIEADTRECGIRVDKPGHGLKEDMRADVEGTVRTNPDGERYIDAAAAVQSSPPNESGHVDPLGMNSLSLGGGDWLYDQGTGAGQKGVKGGFGLNNIGLLARVCGRVVEIEPVEPSAKPTWFKIKDGFGVSVKCLVPSTVTINPGWTFVAVTGVSSCEKVGEDLHRLIRVRKPEDITPY